MNQRAAERECENHVKMEGKANKQDLCRRCWCSVCEMEEWKLTVLLFISSLSLWGLCTVVLPCAPGLLAILGLGTFMIWWPNIEAKGISLKKSCLRSRRKDPTEASDPWKGVESIESVKAGCKNPHEEQWETSCSKEAASVKELPRVKEDMAQGGSFGADTRSELLGKQPSTTNMEELATSLMESLDVSQICLDLLGQLRETQDGGAPIPGKGVRTEYLVCLQCRRCPMGSCPHQSEPVAEQDLHTLAACLHTADVLLHEEDLQLEMGLGFELAIGGKLVYVWEVTQRLPEIPPERCCEKCKAPLPRSPGDNESSQPWFTVLGAQETPTGQMGLSGQDTRAPSAEQSRTQCSSDTSSDTGSDSSRGDLRPAEQESPLPTKVPTWLRLPRAQPPSPAAADGLRRVRTEPRPWVQYKGLGQGISLQCIRQSWTQLKSSVRKSIEDARGWLQRVAGWTNNGTTTEEDQTLPFHLRFKVDALFHSMGMEA